MMQSVVKVFGPHSGPDNPLPQLRVTIFPKCGHITRRDHIPGRLWVKIRCEMCAYLYKEREAKNEKRARKIAKREARKRKLSVKLERLNMAKKKMASKKVVKKAKLKKATGSKVGRKLMLVGQHLFAPKGSLLARVLKAMGDAEDRIMGENELVTAMEKAGVKPEGKKTVKKLVKGILRNMLRAGVVVKQREIKHNEELAAFVGDGDDEEDESEDGDDDSEDEDSEDADGDGDDSDDEDSDDEEADEEEKPKAKKKVVKKAAGKKK